ncbi:hypothetical protein BS50DRAFT_622456 [Corynespora cassiicola Philippines]|uniref:Uncharacterized protein n=1 Tax=Corynespora cassiicola Philippines TaxID=1448308 RepID=A0A2T2NIB9_CORCC|nr:hypothetical protein BS50DRAFT_622456 [Corynespora cassiicola Philippines]
MDGAASARWMCAVDVCAGVWCGGDEGELSTPAMLSRCASLRGQTGKQVARAPELAKLAKLDTWLRRGPLMRDGTKAPGSRPLELHPVQSSPVHPPVPLSCCTDAPTPLRRRPRTTPPGPQDALPAPTTHSPIAEPSHPRTPRAQCHPPTLHLRNPSRRIPAMLPHLISALSPPPTRHAFKPLYLSLRLPPSPSPTNTPPIANPKGPNPPGPINPPFRQILPRRGYVWTDVLRQPSTLVAIRGAAPSQRSSERGGAWARGEKRAKVQSRAKMLCLDRAAARASERPGAVGRVCRRPPGPPEPPEPPGPRGWGWMGT